MNENNMTSYKESIRVIKDTIDGTRVDYAKLSWLMILYGVLNLFHSAISRIMLYAQSRAVAGMVSESVADNMVAFAKVSMWMNLILTYGIWAFLIIFWFRTRTELKRNGDKQTLKLYDLWAVSLFVPKTVMLLTGIPQSIPSVNEQLFTEMLPLMRTVLSVGALFATLSALVFTAITIESKSLVTVSVLMIPTVSAIFLWGSWHGAEHYVNAVQVTESFTVVQGYVGTRLEYCMCAVFIALIICGICLLPKNVKRYGLD